MNNKELIREIVDVVDLAIENLPEHATQAAIKEIIINAVSDVIGRVEFVTTGKSPYDDNDNIKADSMVALFNKFFEDDQ